MTFIEKYICLNCHKPLNDWKPADFREPNGPSWDASCDCGQTFAIKVKDDRPPTFKTLMINLYQENPKIEWSIMIIQRETPNGAHGYKVLAAPHCFSGSNPFNIFVWAYRNTKWQLKLRGFPKYICAANSNQELNDQLNLLLTFS